MKDKRLSAQVAEDVLAVADEVPVASEAVSEAARSGEPENDALDFADQMRRKMLAVRNQLRMIFVNGK